MVIGPSPTVQQFIMHWRSLLKDGLVPTIQEFLSHPSPELQPYVLLLDVLSETEVTIRLIGTGLVQLTGRELTRTNALDIYAPHLRKRVGQACMMMITQPCGQVTERLMNTSGGVMIATTGIALPLANKDGVVKYLAAYNSPREPVATGENGIIISDISAAEWVDIGAGTPARKS